MYYAYKISSQSDHNIGPKFLFIKKVLISEITELIVTNQSETLNCKYAFIVFNSAPLYKVSIRTIRGDKNL